MSIRVVGTGFTPLLCFTGPSTVFVITLLPINKLVVSGQGNESVSGIKVANSDVGRMTQRVKAPASGKT